MSVPYPSLPPPPLSALVEFSRDRAREERLVHLDPPRELLEPPLHVGDLRQQPLLELLDELSRGELSALALPPVLVSKLVEDGRLHL